MSGEITERAIVLRTVQYGDADLIAHCLNRRGSRLNVIAKGARKSRRRFAGGVLEPTHYIELSYRQKKSQDPGALQTLREASLLEAFHGLRQDYERLELAFHFLSLTAQVAQEDDLGSAGLFDLLGNALKNLEVTESLNSLQAHFEIKLLAEQGVLPLELQHTPFFSQPLSEHHQLDLDRQTMTRLRSHLSSALKEYIE